MSEVIRERRKSKNRTDSSSDLNTDNSIENLQEAFGQSSDDSINNKSKVKLSKSTSNEKVMVIYDLRLLYYLLI